MKCHVRKLSKKYISTSHVGALLVLAMDGDYNALKIWASNYVKRSFCKLLVNADR